MPARDSPQIACLREVRECDVVVLILGERYGTVQDASGLAPTHEEFREARDRKPVFVFVQKGVATRTPAGEVCFGGGGLGQWLLPRRIQVRGPAREAVTRALHDHQLANAAGPLDPATLVKAAEAQIPRLRRNQRADTPTLHLSIAGGPAQRILRPAQLEAPELGEFIQQQAQFGTQRIFDKAKGTHEEIEGDTLLLVQEGGATSSSTRVVHCS